VSSFDQYFGVRAFWVGTPLFFICDLYLSKFDLVDLTTSSYSLMSELVLWFLLQPLFYGLTISGIISSHILALM